MKRLLSQFVLLPVLVLSFSPVADAAELKVNDPAPVFSAKTHAGQDFTLASRKGKWTVLFFYPKADTPGCTKQACAFRDAIEKIRTQGADVFGISTDSVADQAAFREKHRLDFTLLADPDGEVVELYGSKMFVLSLSKRWTFIIDPKLRIRSIDKDVDPVSDAKKVAEKLTHLKAADASSG